MASLGTIGIGLTLGSGQFIGGLNRAAEAVTGFTNHVHARFAGLNVGATGFAGVALGMAAGMAKLATSAVETAAHFEDLRVTLEALTGSAEKGQKLLGELTDLAVHTPFQLTDLTKGAQQLLAFGFSADEARGMLERLGDVAAASPGGMGEGLQHIIVALGQIRGAGRVMGQEMRQLVNANIPAWQALADELGTDVAGAMARVRAGTVDARTGIMAILHLAESPRFAGLMEKRAQTLNGLISTLKDSVTIMLRDLGQIIIDAFDLKTSTRQLTAFIDTIRTNLDGLRPAMMFIGNAFSVLRDVAVTALTDVVNWLADFGRGIDANANRLGGMRTAAIDFFETLTKWINTSLNLMVRFGGAVLRDVVAPIMQAAIELGKIGVNLTSSGYFKNPAAATQLRTLMGDVGIARFKVLQRADELLGQPLNAGEDAVTGFWNRIRAMAGGAAGGGGLAKGPLDLNIPGLGGGGPLQLSPAALAGTAEAFRLTSADLAQRQGGGSRDVPALLKMLVDTGGQIKRTLEPLIPLIQANGLGLVFPNG